MFHQDRDDSEIGILDFVVFLTEHWRWFLAAPIIAGLLATICLKFVSPPAFVSEAVIRMKAIDAARVKTEQVLEPALLKSVYLDDMGGSVPDAIRQLIDRDLKVMSAGRDSAVGRGMYRLSLSHRTQKGSQELLERIVRSFLDNSVPQGEKRKNIELRIGELKKLISDTEKSVVRIEQSYDEIQDDKHPSISASEEINSYLRETANSLARRYFELTELHEDMVGSVSRADVIQDVIPATGPRSVSRTMQIIAAMTIAIVATAAALLLRKGFRITIADERQLSKINRIRGAFGIRPMSRGRHQPVDKQEQAPTHGHLQSGDTHGNDSSLKTGALTPKDEIR